MWVFGKRSGERALEKGNKLKGAMQDGRVTLLHEEIYFPPFVKGGRGDLGV